MPNRILYMSLCACICILSIVGNTLAEPEDSWTESARLQRGDAAIHQVQVDDSASFELISPPGGEFKMYAMQVAIPGGCPDETALRGMAFYSSGDRFVLPQGQWCVEVHAAKGPGRYRLNIDPSPASDTPSTTTVPTVQPTTPQVQPTREESTTDLTEPYKVSVQSGTISPNYPNVHSYLVSGERTFLEWIVEPSDCTNPIEIPVVRLSDQDVNALQSATCSLNLDMYVYKDCDPRSYQCTPVATDESASPYAYIGIADPLNKSRYYVLVQSAEGSGAYTLTSRGYVLNHEQSAAMVAQNDGTQGGGIQNSIIQINSVQGIIPEKTTTQGTDAQSNTKQSGIGTSIYSFSFSSMY